MHFYFMTTLLVEFYCIALSPPQKAAVMKIYGQTKTAEKRKMNSLYGIEIFTFSKSENYIKI